MCSNQKGDCSMSNYYPMYTGNPAAILPSYNTPQYYKNKYCGYQTLGVTPYLRPMPMAIRPKAETTDHPNDSRFKVFLRKLFS